MQESPEQDILENEPEIVEQAKKDDQAFEILYHHYFPKIYGYIFKRVGNHETTEDIVSITFVKVFTNLSKYNNKGYTFGAWVYKIATNNLVDHYRKQGRNKEVGIEEANEIKDESLTPEDQVQISQDKESIKVIINKLPKRYQKVLNLKFFAELSITEIAHVMDISENNSRVLTFRALKKFHKLYEKH